MLVALDLSTTCTGVAVYKGGESLSVFTIAGSPISQFSKIRGILQPLTHVIYEQHVHFRNAKVTRILNELNGYIAHRLREDGFVVTSNFPGKGRKELVAKYEEMGLTKDELDAAILVNSYYGRKDPFEIERISFSEYRNVN